MKQFFNIIIPANSTAFVKQTFPSPVRKFKVMAAQGIKVAINVTVDEYGTRDDPGYYL